MPARPTFRPARSPGVCGRQSGRIGSRVAPCVPAIPYGMSKRADAAGRPIGRTADRVRYVVARPAGRFPRPCRPARLPGCRRSGRRCRSVGSRPAAASRSGSVVGIVAAGGEKRAVFSLTSSVASTLPDPGFPSLLLEKDEPLRSEHRAILRPNATMQSSTVRGAPFEYEGPACDEPHLMPSISARIVARSLKSRHDLQTAANGRKKGRVSIRLFSGRILVRRRTGVVLYRSGRTQRAEILSRSLR